MNYRIVFTPEAEEQLASSYCYIASVASPDIAARYTEAIVIYCEGVFYGGQDYETILQGDPEYGSAH